MEKSWNFISRWPWESFPRSWKIMENEKIKSRQGWGQVHRYFNLPVLKCICLSTCLYFVRELQKCTCTCTQVHYNVLGT